MAIDKIDAVSNADRKNYWCDLSNSELVERYILPHMHKARLEGHYVGEFVLKEVARRLTIHDS
jgi:hypothetical protein